MGMAVEQIKCPRRRTRFASDQMDRKTADLLGELCRAVKGPVRNDYRFDPARDETSRGSPLVSPAPRIITRRPARSPKIFLRVPTATAPTDAAPRAIRLRCGRAWRRGRVLEELVQGDWWPQPAAVEAFLTCPRISVFQDHRVKPAGDAEKVLHTPRCVVKVERGFNPCSVTEERLQRIECAHWAQAGRIEFNAVASREDDSPGESVDSPHGRERLYHPWPLTANFSRISSGAFW
jgi:hypothetical protein